jgi:hypothetical protein
MRATRANTIIRQYLISIRRKKTNGLHFSDVLELLSGMIYLAVHRTTTKYNLPPFMTDDDLIQEGRVTLLLCLHNFQLDNDEAHFTSYFRRALYNNLRHAVLKANHGGKDPSLFADPIPDDDGQGDADSHVYWPKELTNVAYKGYSSSRWESEGDLFEVRLGKSPAVEIAKRILIHNESVESVASDMKLNIQDVIVSVESVLGYISQLKRRSKQRQISTKRH